MTDWKKAYTTWVNGALAVLAAATAAMLWLSQQADTPIPVHVLAEALAAVGAVTVFLRRLPQGEKPTKDESGFVGIKLMLILGVLALALALAPLLGLAALGCSPQSAKTASHLASNGAAEAISWLDARLAAQYELKSQAELAKLAAKDLPLSEWERWRVDSGWSATIEAVALAHDAHALLVAHLDGTKASTAEQRRQALEAVTKAVGLGLTLLEQEGVEVPPYVRAGAQQLPALGALL